MLLPFAFGLEGGTVVSQEAQTNQKTEHFESDPGWEAHHNRIEKGQTPTVKQDFGYSATSHTGKSKGEVGGTITRASKPAFYGKKIAPKTLDDKLSASGTFAVTDCHGSAGMAFGWFNTERRGEAGRPMNALALEFAGEARGPRLAIRLTAESNRAIGTKVTPFIKDRKKVKGAGNRAFDAVQPDGTRYSWTLNYDPQANDGNGRIEFTIQGNGKKHQPWEGKPVVINVPAEVREAGATFDHFGLLNNLKPGRVMEIYFGDLSIDGAKQDLSTDPGWDEFGNRSSHLENEQHAAHDFGFSQSTNFAGGTRGEIGGIMWRSGDYGYYADHVGPLSLEDRLEASGKVILTAGPADSGMYFGWFNSDDDEHAPTQAGDFVGVKIGGPSKVGHYFLPTYAPTKTTPIEYVGKRDRPENIAIEPSKGPVLSPEKCFTWKLIYDPTAEKGRGAITATLGDQSVTLPLKPGDKAKGAKLDRFGLFTAHHGGNFLKIYFDDLQYTASR